MEFKPSTAVKKISRRVMSTVHSSLTLTFLLTLPFNFSHAENLPKHRGYIVKIKGSQENFLQRMNRNVSNFSKKILKAHQTQNGSYLKIEESDWNSDVASFLKNDSQVEYVEPNWIIRLKNTPVENGDAKILIPPTDNLFGKQWGLQNTGKNGGIFGSSAGEDINILKAWDLTKGSEDVKVAVIDTGVDYRHPDLKDQMDVNEQELNGTKGVDDDGNGFVDDVYGYDFSNNDGDPADGHSHGTHCAGVIGASHDGKGTVGVMAKVKIIGIKFMSDRGEGESIDAIKSIDYAVLRGAKVLSNSWGGDEYSKALEEAILRAHSKGVVFVAASGNESNNNDKKPVYPASYNLPNMITVGSFSGSGSASGFSNYGMNSVHVFAPGSSIISTVPNGRYTSMSGTSMACPHVAGVVGLMVSLNPRMTPEEIRSKLIFSSKQNNKLIKKSVSNGRVDAYNALLEK